MNTQPTQDLYTELYDAHWRHVRNWKGVDPKVMAERHDCSVEHTRFVMRDIEREYPKRKQVRRQS